VSFVWPSGGAGVKTITVTAGNNAGMTSAAYEIYIECRVYLPLMMRR
jgi:hypothetical protein